MHVVLIETSGNQAYIFATNKLRENVGASQLTFQAGTTFVLDAVTGLPVEVLLAVSGKALLLVQDAATGRKVVSAVTLRALKETPGLDVRGVVGSEFDAEKDPIHPRIKEAHQMLEQLRSRVPGPAARFPRLPVIAECATSGLPAARVADDRDRLPAAEHGPRSAVSLAKQQAAQAGLARIRDLVHPFRLPYATTELEDLGCDWLAVVHADGNGLGKVFLHFDEHAGDNRDYIDKLHRFSLALDHCTERAFCAALRVLKRRARRQVLPIVPLVLGGDDLTVVCDGRQALQFVKAFLDAFERLTAAEPVIAGIMGRASSRGKVTSSAGVAVVKPHFPFHAAYELAEELLRSAKKQKPHSAVDFHILYDASGPDLERIRAELSVEGGQTSLVARPYVTTAGEGPQGQRWADLERRVEAVRARDEDNRRRLPGSMLHELREGLFFGRAAADYRLRLVRERYRQQGLEALLGETAGAGSLFWPDGQRHVTGLLDALDLTEFWEGQP